MTKKTDGESIAVLEANMGNIDKRLTSIEDSMIGLHAKVDTFMKVLTDNYVPVKAFEEYKRTQIEKEKSRNLEKILWLVVGTVVTGLIAFFLREAGT